MKTISHDDYLRLLGLLVLAESHRQALTDIERSARAITGDQELGHTDQEIWGGDYGVQHLLELLEISVKAPPRPATTPEDAARQAGRAEQIAEAFGDLFEGRGARDEA